MSRAVMPADAALLLNFALGYMAVLAAPGPNMLATGALAALRGFRAVLPFCAGVGAGAGILAASMHLAFGVLTEAAGMDIAARLIGAGLLLWIALRVMRSVPPQAEGGRGRVPPARDSLVAFAAGFCTAATNPITAAYFIAQFLGPLAETAVAPLAPLLATVQALAFGLLVAAVFARPAARRLALAHHHRACLASAAVLAGLAVLLVAPLVAGRTL